MRVTAAHVDVAGVVPSLRGVGQQVDGADGRAERTGGTAGRRRRRDGYVAGQGCAVYELEKLQRAARSDGPGTRRRVVDEVGALQVNAARAEITDFESRFAAEAFFNGGAPLLDVFGRRVGIEGGEADGGSTEHCGCEIQGSLRLRRRKQRCRRREIIKLLRLRKNVGDVVALVAPGVEIDWRKENAVGAVDDEAEARKILRDAQAGREVALVGEH